MKRDKIVELLGWRLGDRTDMVPRAIAEMDLVQESILEGNPWLPWFLDKSLPATTVSTSALSIPLPDDFLMEIEEEVLWIVTAEGQRNKVVAGDFENLMTKYPGSGLPQGYCIRGGKIELFPLPDREYSVFWAYSGKDALMSAENEETLWLKYASDLVIALLGRELAEKHLQNAGLAAAFSSQIGTAWGRLLSKHTGLREATIARAFGGPSS